MIMYARTVCRTQLLASTSRYWRLGWRLILMFGLSGPLPLHRPTTMGHLRHRARDEHPSNISVASFNSYTHISWLLYKVNMYRRRPMGAPTPAMRRTTETPFGKVQPTFDGFELANSSWGEEDSLSLPVTGPSEPSPSLHQYTIGLDTDNTPIVVDEFETFEETVFTGRGERVPHPEATPDRKGKRKAESPGLPATVTKRRARRPTIARPEATPRTDDVFGRRMTGPSCKLSHPRGGQTMLIVVL